VAITKPAIRSLIWWDDSIHTNPESRSAKHLSWPKWHQTHLFRL